LLRCEVVEVCLCIRRCWTRARYTRLDAGATVGFHVVDGGEIDDDDGSKGDELVEGGGQDTRKQRTRHKRQSIRLDCVLIQSVTRRHCRARTS